MTELLEQPQLATAEPKTIEKVSIVISKGSLEGIYANLDKILNKKQREALENSRANAFLSKELVTIKTDCGGMHPLEDYKFDGAKALLTEFGSIAAIAATSDSALQSIPGIGPERAAALQHPLKGRPP